MNKNLLRNMGIWTGGRYSMKQSSNFKTEIIIFTLFTY